MARIVFNGNFRKLANDTSELELDVRDVRGLFRELGKRFPELAPHLEEGVALAINGVIFQEALYAEIPPDSEVHLLPAIGGG